MLTKPTLKNFIFYTFISNALIYLFQFLLNKNKVNYYECTEIKVYDFSIFSRKFDFIYPESCDLDAYLQGVQNIQNFYNIKNYVYFDRPLFILYISIFYWTLNFVLSQLPITSLVLIKASFFLGQLFLTSIICVLICRILDFFKVDISKMYFTLPWMVSVSPMFKWHIYESTSMTFTFLIFLLGVHFVLNFDYLNHSSYFFYVGLLFLVHRSAALITVFIFLFSLLTKKINYKFLRSSLFFFAPILLHYLILIFYSGFEDHQAQGYRQFVWLIDFIQGKDTIIGGYFCQSPKLALVCYKNDLMNLGEYLLIPIVFLLLILITSYRYKFYQYKKLIIISITFAILINSFWLFIGWYPPIRFSYYGLGNLIIFLLLFVYAININKISKTIFLFAYTSNFLFLNHWNYSGVVENSIFLFISSFFFLLYVILNYESNQLRDKSKEKRL